LEGIEGKYLSVDKWRILEGIDGEYWRG